MHNIMSIRLVCLAVTVLLSSSALAAGEPGKDAKGSKDDPRISRFQGAVISSYKSVAFGQAELLLSVPNSKMKAKNVEGRVTTIIYDIPKDHDTHEVYRSYRSELEKAGFTALFACVGHKECGGYDFPSYFQSTYGFMGNTQPESQRYLAMQGHAPTGDTFVTLYVYLQPPAENRAILTIVDSAPLNNGLVTVGAEALARGISGEGRTIVYGVYFDTDSGALKPESEPALKEMAKVLTDHLTLKVFVVGHTDNVGQLGRNLELSQKRAESVAKTLVSRYHIAANRVEGRGVGPLAPVASNRSEEGRAKNRRVEMVER